MENEGNLPNAFDCDGFGGFCCVVESEMEELI
jgi:hypothetical protein